MVITYDEIRKNSRVNSYIKKADESLLALGYTEHSFAHVTKVADLAAKILTVQGYSKEEIELAKIAGYLHDIGNVINRVDHAQSGAVMAFRILDNMGEEPENIATIITAIGNHDENTAYPVNAIAAALILADKTDVRRSRVRNTDFTTFDIHDNVNYSVVKSEVIIEKDKFIELRLSIDTSVCVIMDYFEIFLGRMRLCRKAADVLKLEFRLTINNQQLI